MRRLAPPRLAFAFALFGATLAILAMRVLGTPILDVAAYRFGALVAAASGLGVGLVVPVVRRSPRLRFLTWVLVPLAGGVVGMAVQGALLARVPPYRTYVLASGLTTGDATSWVLAGLPLGALPALLAAGVVAVAFRVTQRAAQDDRERMMLPFASACGLLGAAALGTTNAEEAPVVVGVVVLSALALLEILLRDRSRARFLRAVFSGTDPSLTLVVDEAAAREVPPVVGAAPVQAVIMRVEAPNGYRGAARTPLAATAFTEEAAVRPLARRQTIVLAVLAATPCIAGLLALATL